MLTDNCKKWKFMTTGWKCNTIMAISSAASTYRAASSTVRQLNLNKMQSLQVSMTGVVRGRANAMEGKCMAGKWKEMQWAENLTLSSHWRLPPVSLSLTCSDSLIHTFSASFFKNSSGLLIHSLGASLFKNSFYFLIFSLAARLFKYSSHLFIYTFGASLLK